MTSAASSIIHPIANVIAHKTIGTMKAVSRG